MFPVRNQILIETTSRACVQSTGYLTQFGPQLRSLSLCREVTKQAMPIPLCGSGHCEANKLTKATREARRAIPDGRPHGMAVVTCEQFVTAISR